jgi:hypothetical protein
LSARANIWATQEKGHNRVLTSLRVILEQVAAIGSYLPVEKLWDITLPKHLAFFFPITQITQSCYDVTILHFVYRIVLCFGLGIFYTWRKWKRLISHSFFFDERPWPRNFCIVEALQANFAQYNIHFLYPMTPLFVLLLLRSNDHP